MVKSQIKSFDNKDKFIGKEEKTISDEKNKSPRKLYAKLGEEDPAKINYIRKLRQNIRYRRSRNRWKFRNQPIITYVESWQKCQRSCFLCGLRQRSEKPKKGVSPIKLRLVVSFEPGNNGGGIIRFTLNRPDRRIKVGIWSGRASKIISSTGAGDPQKEFRCEKTN